MVQHSSVLHKGATGLVWEHGSGAGAAVASLTQVSFEEMCILSMHISMVVHSLLHTILFVCVYKQSISYYQTYLRPTRYILFTQVFLLRPHGLFERQNTLTRKRLLAVSTHIKLFTEQRPGSSFTGRLCMLYCRSITGHCCALCC